MKPALHRLLGAIHHPSSMATLSEQEWDALLRHSRRAGLLSRLALDAQDAGLYDNLPPRVRRHMQAAVFVAERQKRAIHWEVHKLHKAIGYMGIPIVLLKGAAYVMAELPPSRGRLFGDIDLLVPRQNLTDVELELRLHGWHGVGHDDYDQRYYREWTHEIPPVTHISRGSTLDIHHNILPLTARLKPQASDLLADIKPIPGLSNFYRLGDEDLVLHSATHLFHEGEWGNGLRDLVDIHSLLGKFCRQHDFMDRLTARAQKLDLSEPFHLAVWFNQLLLGISNSNKASKVPMPNAYHRWLFQHGFSLAHPDLSCAGSAMAGFLLYLRSHFLRMPMTLLIPHLARKTVRTYALKDQ